jgi:hypothetical protein
MEDDGFQIDIKRQGVEGVLGNLKYVLFPRLYFCHWFWGGTLAMRTILVDKPNEEFSLSLRSDRQCQGKQKQHTY